MSVRTHLQIVRTQYLGIPHIPKSIQTPLLKKSKHPIYHTEERNTSKQSKANNKNS